MFTTKNIVKAEAVDDLTKIVLDQPYVPFPDSRPTFVCIMNEKAVRGRRQHQADASRCRTINLNRDSGPRLSWNALMITSDALPQIREANYVVLTNPGDSAYSSSDR